MNRKWIVVVGIILAISVIVCVKYCNISEEPQYKPDWEKILQGYEKYTPKNYSFYWLDEKIPTINTNPYNGFDIHYFRFENNDNFSYYISISIHTNVSLNLFNIKHVMINDGWKNATNGKLGLYVRPHSNVTIEIFFASEKLPKYTFKDNYIVFKVTKAGNTMFQFCDFELGKLPFNIVWR